jgi:hypothetical protein
VSRRACDAEKKPQGSKIAFRVDAELTAEERRDLAQRVIARGDQDGKSGRVSLGDLVYASVRPTPTIRTH